MRSTGNRYSLKSLFHAVKQRRTTVFMTILQAFLVVIIPMYMISILLNFQSQQDVRNEIGKSAENRIHFYMNLLEKEFENIIRNEVNLIIDKDINEISNYLRTGKLFEFTQAANNIQNRLVQIKYISNYISNVSVYIPEIGKKITNYDITDLSMDEFAEMKKIVQSGRYPFYCIDQYIYINITSAHYLGSQYLDRDPWFIISVRILRDEVAKGLNQFADYEDSGAILVGADNGLTVIQKKQEALLPEILRILEKQNFDVIESGIDGFTSGKDQYIMSFYQSDALNSVLVAYAPEKQFLSSLERYKNWFWIISGITALFILLFTQWVRGLIVRPLDKLVFAFKKVQEGELNIPMKYDKNDEFGYLYKRFNDMCKRLSMLIEQVYEQRILAQSSELKQLQYQINPHFLYNSFFILYRMAKMQDLDTIIKFTHHLGNYYQFVTRNSSDEVELYKEVGHVRDYIEIQAIRFSGRIQAEFDEIPPELVNMKVPRLILQPIVENSYNHGLKNKVRDGKLSIRFEKEETSLQIWIEDNGTEMDEEKLEQIKTMLSDTNNNEHTGLLNVHRRLQIRYGSASGISVCKSIMGGLCVKICLLLEEETEHVQVTDH